MSAYLEHQFILLKCLMKPWTRLTRGQIYVRTFISLQKPAHLESTAMQRAPCVRSSVLVRRWRLQVCGCSILSRDNDERLHTHGLHNSTCMDNSWSVTSSSFLNQV